MCICNFLAHVGPVTGRIILFWIHSSVMTVWVIFEWAEGRFCTFADSWSQLCTGKIHTYVKQCVEERVAIALWCLATPVEYHTVGHYLGVARSTVCIILHTVVKAIIDILLKWYVQFPTGKRLWHVISGFESRWNFPQCAGGIDGCHIPVQARKLNIQIISTTNVGTL